MKRILMLLLGAAVLLPWVPARAQTETNIADAKRDVAPLDYFPDDITTYYVVHGRVTSASFATNNIEFFIEDTNDNVGILVWRANAFTNFSPGVELSVLGLISQTAGVRRINPEFNSDVQVVDPTEIPVVPLSLSLGILLADPEAYEGTLVLISNLVISSGSWPAWKSSGTFTASNTDGRVSVRVDADTDADGQLGPTNAFDLQGIFTQFDTSATPTGGYQVLLRAYSDAVQYVGDQPPSLSIENSNTLSVATNQTVTIRLLGRDRNAADTLTITTNSGPAGGEITNLPDREARFDWTPSAEFAGTTNHIVFEVTDGISTSTAAIDVFVLSEELANIRLNEVHWDPAPDMLGDANGDGVRDAVQDEFVEIVNNNDTSVDISGWAFKYGAQVYYTFPATVLSGKSAVVVFGGGAPSGYFGDSIVGVATSAWSGLGTSSSIGLVTSNGTQIFSYDYSSFSSPDQSATRIPDLVGDFALHTNAEASLRWSPGLMSRGKTFPGVSQTNTPPILTPLNGVSVGTDQGVVVAVRAFDPDTNNIALTVSNAPASASFTDLGNGTGTLAYTGLVSEAGSNFLITVNASDGVSNSVRRFSLVVMDARYVGLVINEICGNASTTFDANNDGVFDQAQDEYVEIINATTGALDVAGIMLYDNTGLRHRFTSQLVPTGGAIVVFAGGSLLNFTNRPAQIASSAALGLNNDGDVVLLYTPQTNEITRQDFLTNAFPVGASFTRFPDVTGDWTNHYAVTTNTVRGSPGTRVNGQPFLSDAPYLRITNPATASITVTNTLAAYDVQGTANTNVLGEITWTNSLTGSFGSVGAATNWSIASIALNVGINTIVVRGTNGTGLSIEQSVVITRQAAAGGGLVYVQGFEGTASDTWPFGGGGSVIDVAARTGAFGYRLGGTQTITFSNVDVSGYSSLVVVAHISSTGGVENADRIELYVGLDGAAFPATPELWIGEAVTNDGNYNKTWGYDASGVAETTAGIPLRFHGDGASGYAEARIILPSGTTNARLLVKSVNNSGTEYYQIDDISVMGEGGGGGPADTDADGMSDDYETTYFTNATAGVAGNDDDGDGFSNLEEYLADTIPNGPNGSNSLFEVLNFAVPGTRAVSFVASTGRVYTFQFNDNLLLGTWSNLVTDSAGTNATTTLADTNAAVTGRSYRVRVRVP